MVLVNFKLVVTWYVEVDTIWGHEAQARPSLTPTPHIHPLPIIGRSFKRHVT